VKTTGGSSTAGLSPASFPGCDSGNPEMVFFYGVSVEKKRFFQETRLIFFETGL
jgi:hypothetical protein